jgi:D-amino-acid dehydrogenase
MYDAIVIGGGVVGMSLAYHLVRAGARTLLADRADAERATNAGAGILTPEVDERTPDAQFDLAVAANAYYPTLIAQLAEEQAGDTGYAVCGQLSVVVSDDELAPFAAARRAELGRQRSEVSAAYAPYEISPDEARQRFPALAPVSHALYYPRSARVDGRMITEALRRAAIARGLEVRQVTVERLIVEDDSVAGVEIEGERCSAGALAIAGGAWSPRLGFQLGVQIPVSPQRGQIVHLRLHGADTGDWPVVSGFRGHYIVPWPGGRVVAGATREAGAGFAAHTTAAGIHSVLGEALRVASGLAGAEIAEIRVGLRPASADGMPILGSVPGVRNAYLATGHGPHGLQLGPYSCKLMAELMLGSSGAEIAAFGVGRFTGSEGT